MAKGLSSLPVSLGLAKPVTSYALAPKPTRSNPNSSAYVAPTTNRTITAPAPVASSGGGGRGYYSPFSSGGSGGGGGGGSVAAAPVAPPKPTISLSDYINKNYALTSLDAENSRKMKDFDATTASDEAQTRADQAKRSVALDQSLAQQGDDNAESFASRGLGRSGLVFQAQDKIDADGENQKDAIGQLLTNLVAQRQQGRVSQDEANRAARLAAIQKLTDAYNTAATAGNLSTLTTQ